MPPLLLFYRDEIFVCHFASLRACKIFGLGFKILTLNGKEPAILLTGSLIGCCLTPHDLVVADVVVRLARELLIAD